MASAVCVLVGTEGVSGTVTFTAEGGATKVSGEITGLVRFPAPVPSGRSDVFC